MDENEMGLSDSSDNYSEDNTILLDQMSKKERKNDDPSEAALYGFDEDDDQSDVDMGSDLDDGQDHLPDDRAWGQRRKNFYNTDFDKDYTGAYGAEDAEIAEMEENEARNIQKRLMEQLSDADFSLADIADTSVSQSEQKSEVIQTDLSLLTKRQKLELFAKEAPEFSSLVNDFEEKMTEVRERLLPVLDYVKEGKLKPSSAVDFVQTKYRLILNYCTNIVFYILLKTKRISVKDHPVLKALFRYRQLLLQLQPVDDEVIAPQVDKILQVFSIDESQSNPEEVRKKKKLLKIIKKTKGAREKALEDTASDEPVSRGNLERNDDSGDDSHEEDVDELGDGEQKRAITYEMAKNKGLTPKRSKEQRNPRVKHRNKFRKSLIRRRGQVRTPRTEIPVYGGEPTGIKIGLKKGRKFK